MTLGGIDNSKIAVGATVQFVASDPFWDVIPNAIFVNNKAVVLPSSETPINQTPFIFDTGVPNLVLSTAITEVGSSF